MADVAPSAWVERWLSRAPFRGRLLDFACGSGRHARLANDLGYSVLAVDQDDASFAALGEAGIAVLQEDLESGPWTLADRRFDVIVCTNYLHRPRLDLLCALLAPGGMLVYETFAAGNERHGRPRSPQFLLRPGELAGLAQRAGLRLVAYEDGFLEQPRPARVQRAVAVREPFEPESLALG
jgi:SAM-dependent methyltransferase